MNEQRINSLDIEVKSVSAFLFSTGVSIFHKHLHQATKLVYIKLIPTELEHTKIVLTNFKAI